MGCFIRILGKWRARNDANAVPVGRPLLHNPPQSRYPFSGHKLSTVIVAADKKKQGTRPCGTRGSPLKPG